MKMIKPYGDTLNDGIVQLSFTLPVEYGAKAKKAAEIYVSKLNFENISVVHAKKIYDGFTYFIVYAKAKPELDYSTVKTTELEITKMEFDEINKHISEKLGRPISIVGATIGSDAHTVGIDAIMNMKGYKQDYGLERYPQINTCNMGAQVSYDALMQKAAEMNADAILISQTVTKNDCHVRHLREFIELLKSSNLRNRFVLITGGAGITNDLAVELGYDAGFGSETLPSEVAAYLANRIVGTK
jgi:beta-lysine 5,6-aminomutase beta subunit